MKDMMAIFIVGLLCGVVGALLVTSPSKTQCVTPPAVAANCQKLTPLLSNDFGATTLKLRECGEQYNVCRTACTAATPKEE